MQEMQDLQETFQPSQGKTSDRLFPYAPETLLQLLQLLHFPQT